VFVHFMLPRFRYITNLGLIGTDAPCGKPECDFLVFWRAGMSTRRCIQLISSSLP